MFSRPLTIQEFDRVNGALDALTEVFGHSMFVGEDLITTDRLAGFMQDRIFRGAYELAKPSVQERGLAWRVHTVAWAARRGMQMDGDFVDVGAKQALEAAVVGRMVDFARTNRKWVLFDSFERWRFDPYPNCEDPGRDLSEIAVERVAFMPNAKVVKIASLLDLDAEAPERIAFLRVEDSDPSMMTGAIAKLMPRLCVGCCVILEGYGALRDRADSLDRYLQHLDHPVLELPTGQGLIVKR